jgi:hypothetical protein
MKSWSIVFLSFDQTSRVLYSAATPVFRNASELALIDRFEDQSFSALTGQPTPFGVDPLQFSKHQMAKTETMTNNSTPGSNLGCFTITK